MPRIQVILSEDERQRFKQACEAQGQSMSGMLADWVRATVEKAGAPGQGMLFAEHTIVVAFSPDEYRRFTDLCDGLAKGRAALMHSWVCHFLERMEQVADEHLPSLDLFNARPGK